MHSDQHFVRFSHLSRSLTAAVQVLLDTENKVLGEVPVTQKTGVCTRFEVFVSFTG